MTLDFSSSLYLGMRHPASTLPAWDSLTTGSPAILSEPPLHQAVAQRVAHLQGLERGLIAPSSLHLLFDFFCALDQQSVLFIDEMIYPLTDWASRIATGRGIRVLTYPAQQVQKLKLLLHMHVQAGQRPVVICEGWNPIAGHAAPLRHYLELLRPFQGYLLVDDTQALGILGKNSSPQQPLGSGGGGTLAWMGLYSPWVVSICSLAKGFGVPLAVMSGSAGLIQKFERNSLTRIHCSQTAAPLVAAARQALQVNAAQGDLLRRRLSGLIQAFQQMTQASGYTLRGGMFPVQTLELQQTEQVLGLYHFLQKKGVKALLLRGEGAQQIPLLSFCIHLEQSIDQYRYVHHCFQSFQRNPATTFAAQPESVYPRSRSPFKPA